MNSPSVSQSPVSAGTKAALLRELVRQAEKESSERPHAIFLDLSAREKADLIQDLGLELIPEEIHQQVLADVDAFWRALGAGA